MSEQPLRLAELLASLSLATDLGLGLPEEHVLRQTVIATRLAQVAQLDEETRADTFYVSLLAWVGCVADSHELATWFGDDTQMRADSYQVDRLPLPMMQFMLSHLGSGAAPIQRLTVIGRFLAGGYRDAMGTFVTHCQTTGDIAERLGLRDSVRRALGQAFERWDGKGVPGDLRGSELELAIRLVHIADDAEVFCRAGGTQPAIGMLQTRRGKEFDPDLTDLLIDNADSIFDGLYEMDAWAAVIEGCSALDRPIRSHELTPTLEILADYADLKSPWYLGHSRAVARLARAAAEASGLTDPDLVERAALVHRLGATGISTSIWNKPSPWTNAEAERVRTVPYLTGRVLSRQASLRHLGQIASMSHERLDGSGYPYGLQATSIPIEARLLAAADFYQDLCEDRPRRAALTTEGRIAVSNAAARDGQLDAKCVQAVLAAAGHRTLRRAPQVAGLTAREVEVLRLLVRGLSTKEIARDLSIAPRTVTAHLEHIYAKTGASSRGAAAMFALKNGVVTAD